jgi:hypothetical protein
MLKEPFSYTWYPKDTFALVELIFGGVFGGWLAMLQQARSDDCFSHFWTVIMNLYKYHKLFDSESTWLPEGSMCLMGVCSSVAGWGMFGNDLSKPIISLTKIYDAQETCYK